jgi:hypothetical protein
MNFKPGFSVGYDKYPGADDHEVRERDYFFVISFITWALWAGVGLATLVRRWSTRLRGAAGPLASLGFAAALVPVALNFRDADRGHGPDARLAGDFAYDLLNSTPPYGVLFTYGDNDTFPLWWAQEVEGIRRDVTVVCLALARTDWYMRQLRDNPTRPFEEDRAPAIWRGKNPRRPDWPLHSMTDQEVAAAIPQILGRTVVLPFGPYRVTLDSNTVLYAEDFLSIRVLQQNFGRRPVAWGLTSGGRYYGLDSLIGQRGIGLHLGAAKPDMQLPMSPGQP